MPIQVQAVDHLVITTADLYRCIKFYVEVLGMQHQTFGEGRHSLHFGSSKFNIQIAGQEIEPHALYPISESVDICLIVETPLKEVLTILETHAIIPESEIVERTGANGPIQSVYLRDPDQNLIELSVYSAQ